MRRMKRFIDIKELNEYLKNKAQVGEEVVLDERATATHPKRSHYFMKKGIHKEIKTLEGEKK